MSKAGKKVAQRKQTAQRKPKFSLRGYLILTMLAFLAVALILIWLFQVVLLDVMYESVRKRDLERAADTVAAAIGSQELKSTVYNVSKSGLIRVTVYRIDGDRATPIASEDAIVDNDRLTLPAEHISSLYLKTEQAGGSYHTKITFGGHEVKESFFKDYFSNSQENGPDAERKMVNLIYLQIHSDSTENQYLLMLSSELTPLSPTVNVLKNQFSWMFLILLILILIFTMLMSRWIARPIANMNRAAKQLAQGNYQADFSVKSGYREMGELAESLNFAAGELSRADQMQKELIANISHDLRTPLTMIRGYGEAMRDIPGENTPENIQILIDEAEHLSVLVNDLLDLSKLQSGVQCPTMEFFDLTSAVRDVMERYEAYTKLQGYKINLEAEQSAAVFADRSMILQVIYNLINNAINYIGKDLTVTVRQTVIGSTVRIEVIDHGEGIDEEQLPFIWDRYYKVDRVHRMAKIGTGLGLSIVKGVLEVHNAGYGVRSKPGEGSVFWFELPISEPPKAENTPQITVSAVKRRPL